VAVSVSGGQSDHLDPFVFEIDAQPRTGIPTDRVEKLLYEELDRVASNLVEERELQKAKNTAVADFYRSIKTINGKAQALGTYALVFGDYHRLFEAVNLIQKVSREDVRRVAKKYFTPLNRTVAILAPETPPEGEQKP
jgi:predicted Zn-dependent peptidase